MIREIQFYQITCDTCGRKERSPGSAACYAGEIHFRRVWTKDTAWTAHGFENLLDRCSACTKKHEAWEAERDEIDVDD